MGRRAHAAQLHLDHGPRRVLDEGPQTATIAEVVGKIKGSLSKWIHQTFPDRPRFVWQRGYSAFSVSQSQVSRVAAYIDRQKTHHQKISFRDEYIRLLQTHGILPEEKYLWT